MLLTRPDAPAGRGRRLAAPPAKVVAEGARDPRPAARAAGSGARPRRADGRRVRVRAPDPGGAARRADVAQRPSVAAAALARGGAGRARDHGRGCGDRRDDPRDGRGAGRRAGRRAGVVPDRLRGRCGRRLRARGRGGGAPARLRARRSGAGLPAAGGRADLRGEDRSRTTACSISRDPPRSSSASCAP